MQTFVRSSWMVIVNPKAGLGYGLRDWPIISNQLNKSGIEFTCVFTEKKYHAVELTVKAINDGFRKIIVVGGDGTVNEIVNGMFIQKKVPTTDIILSVIPVGTGNDWVRMYGIPTNYGEAVKSILNCKTVLQDVGLISFVETKITHKRYMANMAGIGFDAIANRYFNRMKDEGKKGKRLYLTGVLKALFKYKNIPFEIEIDGKPFFKEYMFSAAIGIGPYNGGGMKPIPKALFDDGLMDITVIKKMSILQVLKSFRHIYSSDILKHPKVIHSQGKCMKIDSTPPSPIEIDGEACGYSPFTFEIVPRSIAVVVSDKFLENI